MWEEGSRGHAMVSEDVDQQHLGFSEGENNQALLITMA